MKTSIKNKLKKQNLLIGSWITIPDLNIVEIFSNNSFDWLCIDMEHSSIELRDILPLIISIENNGMIPLARVGENMRKKSRLISFLKIIIARSAYYFPLAHSRVTVRACVRVRPCVQAFFGPILGP